MLEGDLTMIRFVKYIPKSIEKNFNGIGVISEGEPNNFPQDTIYINVGCIKSVVGPYEGTDEDKFTNKTGIWIVRLHYIDENIISTLKNLLHKEDENEEDEEDTEEKSILVPLTEADISEDDGFNLDDEIDGLIGDPLEFGGLGNGEFYFPSKKEAQKFINEIIGN